MTVVVIGGGWSGLSAAVTLCQHGESVILLESAKQLGGRARSIRWQNHVVDNGQHLMIGGYQTMLELLKLVGGDPQNLFHDYPLNVSIRDPELPTLTLRTGSWLPWKLSLARHVLKDNGPSVLWQILRLQLAIKACMKAADQSVQNWLKHSGQSTRLIRQLWEPLCLATLNTPITEASAHVFATVLKEMFKNKASSQLLIPKKPLNEIFPNQAASYIKQHGGQIRLQTRAQSLITDNQHIQGIVTDKGEIIHADQVIIATNPTHAHKLYPNIAEPKQSYPITTVYLQFPQPIKLPAPMIGLSGTYSQWVFDRQTDCSGLISVIISGPGQHEQLNNDQLIQWVHDELSRLLTLSDCQPVGFVVREKRATFRCQVGIQHKRPPHQTSITGLWLAGDYLLNPYPATLEGAMLNGKQAAIQLISGK